MSERRREQQAEARLRAIEHQATQQRLATDTLDQVKIGDAPQDGSNYVRVDGAWQVAPSALTSWGTIVGTLSAQTDLYNALESKFDTWESGTAYYDGSVALYVVYGVDGDWQATRATSTQTLSTGAGQSGTKPSTLATLRSLSYS